MLVIEQHACIQLACSEAETHVCNNLEIRQLACFDIFANVIGVKKNIWLVCLQYVCNQTKCLCNACLQSHSIHTKCFNTVRRFKSWLPAYHMLADDMISIKQRACNQTTCLQSNNMLAIKQHAFNQTTYLQSNNMLAIKQYACNQTTLFQFQIFAVIEHIFA